MKNNACILFYAKFPEAGQVKTRLAKDIGDTYAVALARCFILDMLAMFAHSAIPVYFCYAPESAQQAFCDWLGDEYTYWPQQGQDLGERMHHSFQHAFEAGCDKAILIGSDLPDLPVSIVHTAFEQLEEHDTVIGPSDDGGYYLIGFRKAAWLPDIFYDIVWSTADVYTETIRKITEAGHTVYQLSEWSDIDNHRDLQQFYKRSYDRPERAAHTVAYVKYHHIV